MVTAAGRHAGHCFLLESVEGGERLGRYSFVGAGPSELVVVGDAATTPGATHSGDPLVPLEAVLARSRHHWVSFDPSRSFVSKAHVCSSVAHPTPHPSSIALQPCQCQLAHPRSSWKFHQHLR